MTILEEYEFNGMKVLHADLYRLEQAKEFEFIGLEINFDDHGVFFIEWPENLQTDRQEDVIINLEHDKQARCASLICKDNNIESSIKTYYENN